MDSMTWLGISMDEIVTEVAKRQRVNATVAGVISRGIAALDSSLQPAFLEYWNGGPINQRLSVGEFSIGYMMTKDEMTPIAAFLTLDWLIKEPERARRGMALETDTVITHD